MAQLMRPVAEEIKAEDGSVTGRSGSSNTAGMGHITIDLIKKTDEDTEFKLQRFLEQPGSHKFYCPNCKACIENIDVRRRQPGNPYLPPSEPEPPIINPDVRWRQPGNPYLPPSEPEPPIINPDVRPTGPEPPIINPIDPPGARWSIVCESCRSFLVLIGDKLISICNPRPQPPPQPGVPAKKWDILKSIVYGGLLESITSLNIVTSAAGADATTLNILALALANLIGGLFVIGHNLMELRNDQSGGPSTSQDNEETSRYYQQLGLRENFKRHVIVTLLSFLLFGLVAPVTYSFSFLKSGNKDLKLVVVAAASLVCITVLAIGKAYTQKASGFYGYVKTVLSFVIPGFMASGVSYVIGDLIKKLLEKWGLFESSATFTLSLPGTATPEFGWGFY